MAASVMKAMLLAFDALDRATAPRVTEEDPAVRCFRETVCPSCDHHSVACIEDTGRPAECMRVADSGWRDGLDCHRCPDREECDGDRLAV